MLRWTYPDIAGASDYVANWFRKTHDLMRDGTRAGLVGTANIRSGDTRTNSLDYIVDHGGVIYDAVAHQPWSGDATVEVSIVNWIKGSFDGQRTLWLAGGTVRMEVDEIVGYARRTPTYEQQDRSSQPSRPEGLLPGPNTPGHSRLRPDCRRSAGARSSRSRNAAVIHPYLIGRELNDNGQPTRFIIDLSAEDNITARTMAPDAYEWVPRKGAAPPRGSKFVRGGAQSTTAGGRPTGAAELGATRLHAALVAHGVAGETWSTRSRRSRDISRCHVLPWRHASRSTPLSHQDPTRRRTAGIRVLGWLQPRCSPFHLSPHVLRGALLQDAGRSSVTPNTVFDTFPWPQAPTSDAVREVAECAAGIVELQRASLADGMTLGALYDSLSDPGRNPLRTLQKALDAAVAELYGFSLEDTYSHNCSP